MNFNSIEVKFKKFTHLVKIQAKEEGLFSINYRVGSKKLKAESRK